MKQEINLDNCKKKCPNCCPHFLALLFHRHTTITQPLHNHCSSLAEGSWLLAAVKMKSRIFRLASTSPDLSKLAFAISPSPPCHHQQESALGTGPLRLLAILKSPLPWSLVPSPFSSSTSRNPSFLSTLSLNVFSAPPNNHTLWMF